MMQKIKKIIPALVLVVLFAATVVSAPTTVFAVDPQDGLCSGATELKISTNTTAGSSTKCKNDGASTNKVNSTITTAINVFSTIVGVIAVLMIIYGGLRYITSGGDSGKITNAKNTIIYALIGLVVVALAQFIVKFMLSQVTSNTTP
jgi:hypothetical protein